MQARSNARAACLALFLVVGMLLFNLSPAFAASKPVKWSKAKVSVSASQGQTVKTKVKVRSASRLKKVKFVVSGGIKAVVRVTPGAIKTWKKGSKKTATVKVVASKTASPGTYSGTVVAKVGKSKRSKPLRVTVVVVRKDISFAPKTEHVVATQSVGQAGGTIQAPAGTPVAGVRVTFPAGALPGSTVVNLGYNDGALAPKSGTYAGLVLNVDAGPGRTFDRPISVTVPLAAGGKVPVPYYITPTGQLQPAELTAIDQAAGTFTFQTFHASWYTWIYTSVADLVGLGDKNTGFVPNKDGFGIVNYGSDYNRGGECFGMSSFSLWYFRNAKSHGDLYPRFLNQLGTDARGRAITGQNVIATRAFTSIAREWTGYYAGIAQTQLALSAEQRYLSITNAILNTGNPVLIYLSHNHEPNPGEGTHSVLAYGFNGISNRLSIYDPNYPGTEKSAYYRASSKSFSSYGPYENITFNGDGSLHVSEDYQNILQDAEAGFGGATSARVTVTDPTASGTTASERTVRIKGTIESGQILVRKLKIYAGSTQFSTDIGIDGTFDVPVSLESGTNHLSFSTWGVDSAGAEVLAPNNLALTDFTVNLGMPQSVMLVTLTWANDRSDVDLYVTDPIGNTSWYDNKETADGGVLDWDVVSGFGPEHWTLLPTNTVRYGQPYRVRLHYYNDHDMGPTNYTVSVKLYEGTSRAKEYWYVGNLASWDSNNDAPGSSGSDWIDIGSFILTP